MSNIGTCTPEMQVVSKMPLDPQNPMQTLNPRSASLVAVGRMLAVPGAIPGVSPACATAERCGGASGTAACHTPSSGAPRMPKM